MFKPFRNFSDEKRKYKKKKKRAQRIWGWGILYVAKQGHNHAHELSLFFLGKSSIFIKWMNLIWKRQMIL